MNILDLGNVHIYLTSHYSYYKYNLSSIRVEYEKIINHKNIIYASINKANYTYIRELETYINILDFNFNRLTDKINNIFIKKRTKRGILNGLGSIIKAISGNLDAEDGQRYDKLFEKINRNQHTLQTHNLENIRLNKEMITKFNNQIENIKHN